MAAPYVLEPQVDVKTCEPTPVRTKVLDDGMMEGEGRTDPDTL